MSDVRSYSVSAASSGTFGRVIAGSRHHHFVVDGPAENGCPGEALTPGEHFLAGVVCCAVELIEVLAARDGIALRSVDARIDGTIDLANRVRDDVMVFNRVSLDLTLHGVGDGNAEALVTAFQGRCPLYGSVKVATPDVSVRWTAQP